jgi:hypothetical protein
VRSTSVPSHRTDSRNDTIPDLKSRLILTDPCESSVPISVRYGCGRTPLNVSFG